MAKHWSAACAVSLVLYGASPTGATPDGAVSPISFEETDVRVEFSWDSGPCSISLVVYRPGSISLGTLSLRRNCKLPYEDQLRVVGALLDAAAARPELMAHVKKVSWGRPQTPEEHIALINAYLAHRKRSAQGPLGNKEICEILKASNAYGGLFEVFKVRGYTLQLSSVEKAFETKVKYLSSVGIDVAQLAKPVSPETWVLDTASPWFRLEKIEIPSTESTPPAPPSATF